MIVSITPIVRSGIIAMFVFAFSSVVHAKDMQLSPDIALAQSSYHSASGLLELSETNWVYLDFWASWCVPCKYSFPFMNELQRDLGDEGLTVIAVNVDSDTNKAHAFLQTTPAQFSVQYDPQGVIAELFQVPVMPVSYLIKDRQIIGRHVGFKTSDQEPLREQIEKLMQAN